MAKQWAVINGRVSTFLLSGFGSFEIEKSDCGRIGKQYVNLVVRRIDRRLYRGQLLHQVWSRMSLKVFPADRFQVRFVIDPCNGSLSLEQQLHDVMGRLCDRNIERHGASI